MPFFGRGDRMQRYSNYSDQQLGALQNYYNNPLENNPLYQRGSSFLQGILGNDPAAFQAFEAPYMRNFQQNIVPGIAERFAGMGTGAGASSSSGLYSSLGQAGQSLQTDLAALRSGLQMQALPQAMQYAQAPGQYALQGLNYQPYQTYYQPGDTGMFGPLLSAGLTAAGTAFGGPVGAAGGAGLAAVINSMFGKGGGGGAPGPGAPSGAGPARSGRVG